MSETAETLEVTTTPETAAEAPEAEGAEVTPEQPENAADSHAEGETEKPAEKTFTQAQLDKIVSERLARQAKKFADPAKYAEELDARAAELDARELRLDFHDKIQAAELPPEAFSLIDFSSRQRAEETFGAISKIMKQRLDAAVKNEVEKRFKAAGRKPLHSNASAATTDDRLKNAMHAPNFK